MGRSAARGPCFVAPPPSPPPLLLVLVLVLVLLLESAPCATAMAWAGVLPLREAPIAGPELGKPHATCAGDGACVLVAGSAAGCQVARKPAQGAWSPLEELDSGLCTDPEVACAGELCVGAWRGPNETLVVAVSRDSGNSWAPSSALREPTSVARKLDHGVACASSGHCTVAARRWLEDDVVMWHSSDKGASWTGPEIVALGAVEAREIAIACAPDGQQCMLAVTVQGDGGSELMTTSSADGGATWSTATKVRESARTAAATADGAQAIYADLEVACTSAPYCGLVVSSSTSAKPDQVELEGAYTRAGSLEFNRLRTMARSDQSCGAMASHIGCVPGKEECLAAWLCTVADGKSPLGYRMFASTGFGVRTRASGFPTTDPGAFAHATVACGPKKCLASFHASLEPSLRRLALAEHSLSFPDPTPSPTLQGPVEPPAGGGGDSGDGGDNDNDGDEDLPDTSVPETTPHTPPTNPGDSGEPSDASDTAVAPWIIAIGVIGSAASAAALATVRRRYRKRKDNPRGGTIRADVEDPGPFKPKRWLEGPPPVAALPPSLAKLNKASAQHSISPLQSTVSTTFHGVDSMRRVDSVDFVLTGLPRQESSSKHGSLW